MSMILHYYRNFGMRVLGDIDILIERKELPLVDAILQLSGWRSNPAPGFDIHNQEHLNRWHALHFTHSENMHLDLHWSFIEENSPFLDRAVLDQSRPLCSNPIISIPDPGDLLLQTCLHGVKYSPVPLIRWIPDAMTLLNQASKEIDWERLIDLANRARICTPLSLAFQYLVENFDAPIPLFVHKKLKRASSIRLEHLEYWSHAQGHHNIAAWCRFCLNGGHLGWVRQILCTPKYLQSTARLQSLWHLPFFLIYWIGKRFYRKIKSFSGF